ncbi:alkane hydroxylase MAH1-like [Olea europaea var. sylvestris]|uniref:alkane hydroxylase MAH1-like n=1 Tax=Olea europaea var. sylvestris TaxID=158386 RepID=UPI000C1D8974|nr:alkane hydroxylase MAH1-like [Olea europaea var. sylvestris]
MDVLRNNDERNFDGKRKKRLLHTNLPLFGMMPLLIFNIHRIHDCITELPESSTTVWFKGPRFGNMDMLVTCDPANVRYVLSKNFQNFTKAPEFKKIFDNLGDGIFNAESESWENYRRTIMSLINQQGFQKFVATTSRNKVEEGLVPILENVANVRNEVDMQELFQRFTFDCTCILILGHDPASLHNDLPHLSYEKTFADAEEATLYRHILPKTYWKLQKWLQIGKEKKLSKAMDTINQFLMHCISLKRLKINCADQTAQQENEDFDLLTSFMKAAGEKSDAPDNMSEYVVNIGGMKNKQKEHSQEVKQQYEQNQKFVTTNVKV